MSVSLRHYTLGMAIEVLTIAAPPNNSFHMSNASRNWLTSVARIKYHVHQTTLDTVNECLAPSDRGSPWNSEYLEAILNSRDPDYQAWSEDTEKRSLRDSPVREDEAWTYITRTNGMWIWRAVFHSWTSSSKEWHVFEWEKRRSSAFVNLGIRLFETASTVPIEDMTRFSEVLAAVEVQLGVLGSWGELYHRTWDDYHIRSQPFNWHHDLQLRLREAKNQADNNKTEGLSLLLRSPSQQRQDNLILQAIVGVTILCCIYPLLRVLKSPPTTPSSASDADFWLQLTNSILQLVGFATLLLPIYRETAFREWIGTWFLTGLGCCSAIIAIPLYLKAPSFWAAFLSWLAGSSQLLVVLQVALVAAFRREDHAKKD